jgi:CDP-diacylglycerol--glycerol-3-phosphate 3-phosphatidyltransferase
MTISNDSRTRIKGAFEPIALAMGRAGLTPDALTLIGFAITVVGAVMVSQQVWLLGGIVVFVGGGFDLLDGTLARATGKVSRLGAFMDSVFDRWGEALVYLGIVVAGSDFAGSGSLAVLAAFAMGSAFMVSYTRAKSEGLGFTAGTGMAAIGIMPREVRLVILSLGLVLTGVAGTANPLLVLKSFTLPGGVVELALPWAGEMWLAVALLIIAIGATITTIQRILHVRSQARQQATSHPTETNT